MGGLFKDILGSSESLFKEKSDVPLDFSFIPKLVPYREMEQRAIAACIKPLFNEKTGRHGAIPGGPLLRRGERLLGRDGVRAALHVGDAGGDREVLEALHGHHGLLGVQEADHHLVARARERELGRHVARAAVHPRVARHGEQVRGGAAAHVGREPVDDGLDARLGGRVLGHHAVAALGHLAAVLRERLAHGLAERHLRRVGAHDGDALGHARRVHHRDDPGEAPVHVLGDGRGGDPVLVVRHRALHGAGHVALVGRAVDPVLAHPAGPRVHERDGDERLVRRLGARHAGEPAGAAVVGPHQAEVGVGRRDHVALSVGTVRGDREAIPVGGLRDRLHLSRKILDDRGDSLHRPQPLNRGHSHAATALP